MIKRSLMKKITPYSKIYEQRANEIARDFVPAIYPCKNCRNPVIEGYCCTFCRSVEP